MQELCQFSAVNKNYCGTPFADARTMPKMSMQISCQLLSVASAKNPWQYLYSTTTSPAKSRKK
jgi:hypothetical protein